MVMIKQKVTVLRTVSVKKEAVLLRDVTGILLKGTC